MKRLYFLFENFLFKKIVIYFRDIEIYFVVLKVVNIKLNIKFWVKKCESNLFRDLFYCLLI